MNEQNLPGWIPMKRTPGTNIFEEEDFAKRRISKKRPGVSGPVKGNRGDAEKVHPENEEGTEKRANGRNARRSLTPKSRPSGERERERGLKPNTTI